MKTISMRTKDGNVQIAIDGDWTPKYHGVSVVGSISSKKNVGVLGAPVPENKFIALEMDSCVVLAFVVDGFDMEEDPENPDRPIEHYYLGREIEPEEFQDLRTPK